MEQAAQLLETAHELYVRDDPSTESRPPVYKAIGISLAVASGCFIGVSFVFKKIGLLKANEKYDEVAGEGYGYLKNLWWWTGMTLMIVGEICNFVAYAFVDAILVTPLGALSVVITTILSAIFLKERLSLVGKVGCFLCIVGSVVIVMNAPAESSAATIQEMQHFVIAPGFLSYAGVIIVGCVFIALWVAPRYAKRSMLVYLSICSLIGGLSVVATQGLGAAIVTQIGGTPQFNQWFLYVLFVFVIATLVTEIIYLNKALNIFNAALVTPTYYVFFTSSTIVTSAILFQGFKGTPTSIITVVMGFFVICAGVVLLQLSKSAKDVPDTAVFSGDLDQVRTIAEQEQPESEPKADAIRGTAALVRRFSQARQKWEMEEAKRLHEEKLQDSLEPIGENEQYEWDGLRRRKTVLTPTPGLVSSPRRHTSVAHPPLGMSHFPTEEEMQDEIPGSGLPSFLGSIKSRSRTTPSRGDIEPSQQSPMHPVPLTEISIPTSKDNEHSTGYFNRHQHVYGLPTNLDGQKTEYEGAGGSQPHIQFADDPRARSRGSVGPTPPPHSAKRQFSFFRKASDEVLSTTSTPKRGAASRSNSSSVNKNATEEERLGLVKGDSNVAKFPEYEEDEDMDDWNLEDKNPLSPPKPAVGRLVTSSPTRRSTIDSAEEEERAYEASRQKWNNSRNDNERKKRGGGHSPQTPYDDGNGGGGGGVAGAFI